MEDRFDCVVVGGGAAGLSAALILGRARRKALIVDAGQQSNLPAHGVGGLLGHDGQAPAGLYGKGRAELEKYPSVELVQGTVSAIAGAEEDFSVTLDDGAVHQARRILLAGGMDYRIADLPGAEGLWGNTVFHCPFCHGWEVREKPLAVLGNGDRAIHQGLLLRGWTDDVIVLTDGPHGFDADQLGKLDKAGVAIDQRPVSGVVSSDGALTAITFSEGEDLAREGLLLAAELTPRDDLADSLGLERTTENAMAPMGVKVDSFLRTSVDGIYAAGDTAGQMPQVTVAMSSGGSAGAFIVQGLMADEFGLPVPPRERATA